MQSADRAVVVGGIASAATAAKFRAAAPGWPLILASKPPSGNIAAISSDCLDLTADGDDAAAALRGSSLPQRGLVLVCEYQLRDEELVDLLRRSNLATIVLNTETFFDTDPSWTVAELEWDATRARVEYFALDLNLDIEPAWETFLTARNDEFNTADLERICLDFPVILSANFTPENICAIASFPGARGILLTCDELKPILPPERHRVTVDAAVELLTILAAQRK